MSAALHAACAPFGVLPTRPNTRRDTTIDDASAVLDRVGLSPFIAVTGPSGSGKSTLLRGLRRCLAERGARLADTPAVASLERDTARSVADRLDGSIRERLSALAWAGLGDAVLLPRTPAELSAGERARLSLAIAMRRATPGCWLVWDEFASVLDRATAQGVARTVSRWARVSGVRVVAASAHEDLPTLAGADAVVRVGNAGAVVEPAHAPSPVRVRIEQGGRDDHAALAPHHYRGASPATSARVLRAVRTLPDGSERRAGVLVASMPTLNGAWRDLAWPGRFTTGDKRSRAERLNRDLRCISRVIVEPASRGLGIARRLVETYLREHATVATEAVAQMGAYSPFFERAGMHAYPLATGHVDARWLDALDARGACAERGLGPEDAEALWEDPLIRRELERWARDRKLARGLRGLDGGTRVRAAASLACTPAVAYASGRAA